MAKSFKTRWSQNGHPYWVVPVNHGKVNKNGDLKPSYCYLCFAGRRYLFQFNDSNKPEVSKWIKITSLSYKAGNSYSRRYSKRYSGGYSRTPF